jgi:hypothetical protein
MVRHLCPTRKPIGHKKNLTDDIRYLSPAALFALDWRTGGHSTKVVQRLKSFDTMIIIMPKRLALLDRFIELRNSWRPASPMEKLEIEADISIVVQELLAIALRN